MFSNSVIFSRQHTRRLVTLMAGCLLVAFGARAQMLQRPPQMGEPIPPNMVFTLDDSGSMWWECVPDDLCVPPGSTNGISGIPGSEQFLSSENSNFAGIVIYDDKDDAPVYNTSGGIVYDPSGEDTTNPLNSPLPRQLRSSKINPIYYDPNIRYRPWVKENWDESDPDNPDYYWDNADPEKAPISPDDSRWQDLTGIQNIKTRWYRKFNGSSPNSTQAAHIARYYLLKPGKSGDDKDDFVLVKIEQGKSYPYSTDAGGNLIAINKSETRTDCAGNRCTYQEEIRNFANWYTYYRTRALAAIAGTAEGFTSVPETFRIGYGRINQESNKDIDGVSSKTLVRGVRPFTGTEKSDFFDWLAGTTKPSGSTPLRRAMDDVGKYFERSDNRGPWGNKPGTNDGADPKTHVSCRRSIHVLMTDGYWNSSSASTAAARGNVDGTSGPKITGPNSHSETYEAVPPYTDTHSNTLADVAMYYWKRDLRPDLPNKVKPITKDNAKAGQVLNPAFWQHMTNFTIAFGVDGTLRNPEDLEDLKKGTKDWPDPGSGNTPAAVDDLWHAAINSRGQMFSARNADDFREALKKIIDDVAAAGSEAGVAVSTVTLPPTGTDTKLYEPRYSYAPKKVTEDETENSDWTGDIVAKFLDSDGKETKVVAWQAAHHMPAHNERTIFTYDLENGEAKEFSWSNLTEDMKAKLVGLAHADDDAYGESLVAYLRGSDNDEGSTFRKRTRIEGAPSPLGDIVNSTPILVHDQLNSLYQFLPPQINGINSGSDSYAKYYAAKKLRQAQLLVGANDGMLHGFSDEDGTETFAFMPGSVLGSVSALSDPAYTHRYFVDGPMHEADVYDGTKWRNLVQGTGGAGGKYLYAIDMPVAENGATIPLDTKESAPFSKTPPYPPRSDFLWELNNQMADFAELGHVLTKPETGVTPNGKWVTIFGNGYYSSNGTAQLYIVDALTGALVKTIDTEAGPDNGLGGVSVVRDKNLRIVAAYAGDLKGNLWKFDLSSSDAEDWDVAFGKTSLFIAKNDAGQLEPITGKPAFRVFPTGGVMVLFGTGQLFEEGDIADTSARTLYGLWDRVPIGGGAGSVADVVVATDLETQVIISEPIFGADKYVYRGLQITPVDYAAKRGWRLPLTLDSGERLIDQPQMRFDRVFMQTVASNINEDVCEQNPLTRRAYILDPFMSGRLTPVFDGDGDGTYESSIVDLKTSGENILVVKSGSPKEGVIKGACAGGECPSDDPTAHFGDYAIRRTWREIISHP